jgi:hypothetical protein
LNSISANFVRNADDNEPGEKSDDEADDEVGKLVEEEEPTGGSKLSAFKFYFEALGYFVIASSIGLFGLRKVFSVWSNVWLQHWSEMVNTSVRRIVLLFSINVLP